MCIQGELAILYVVPGANFNIAFDVFSSLVNKG
jgi:hypothetical protein